MTVNYKGMDKDFNYRLAKINFDDENNTVEILRPNPNAKDVYVTLPTNSHIEYVKNHWYM